MSKPLPCLLLLLGVLPLVGCGASSDSFLGDFELPVFGSDEDLERQLELPPDLDAPIPTEEYRISDLKTAALMNSSVLPERLNMRLYREGDVVWLAVGADPLSLWPKLRSFYESLGFEIVEANPAHGYLQTDWRERKLQVGAESLVRVRDQFRLHIERDPNALTHVYIANRSSSYYNGEWRLNVPDRTAEWTMLQSLSDYLATLSEVSQARRKTLETARAPLDVLEVQGVPVLSIGQIYSRVWRRLSVALNRAGWKILGNDRSRGIYYARPGHYDEESELGSPVYGKSQLVQLHLLAAGDKTFITAHPAKNNRNFAYEEAYKLLRHLVNAYSVYDD